jgi:D-alanine-D-alanine ligase
MVTSTKGLREKLLDFHGRYGPILVEEYLPGREFNISLCGYPVPRVMPAAEIDFSDFPAELFPIVGYRAKWDSQAPEYHTTRRVFPHHLSPSLLWGIRQVAKECFDLFGLRDYGRVDLRIDERGRPCVLEVNANPCLSPDSGFPAAVAQTGIQYRDMVRDLLHFCAKRGE